jgi:hypothetical protein
MLRPLYALESAIISGRPPRPVMGVCRFKLFAAARPDLPFEKESAPYQLASCRPISNRTPSDRDRQDQTLAVWWRLVPTNFLYCQRRPSWRRKTRPHTRRPVIDRLGTITFQGCQNSAPAGLMLTSDEAGQLVIEIQSKTEVRRYPACKAIGEEVGNNRIRLLTLMPQMQVKHGTSSGGG